MNEDILIADIGGTYSRFHLYRDFNLINKKEFKTRELFQDDFYLELSSIIQTQTILILGVAGRIQNDKVIITNLNQEINKTKLLNLKRVKEVFLCNDFELQCYTFFIEKLSGEFYNYREITKGSCLFIGAGTGLGISVLKFDFFENEFKVISTEFSHELISEEINDREVSLFVKRKLNKKYLEWDDLVSGRGLKLLYTYYSGEEFLSWETVNKQIFTKVLQEFSEIYCLCIFHFIHKLKINGGVYVSGGVLHKNYDILKTLMRNNLLSSESRLQNNYMFFFKENQVFEGILNDLKTRKLLFKNLKIK